MNARTSPLLLSSSPSAPCSPKGSLFTTALTIWRASIVVALLATLLNPWMLSRLPIRLRLPIGRSTSSASISSATGARASSGRPGLTKLTRSSEGTKGVHTTGKQKAQEVPSTYYGSATNSAAEVASSLRSMVSLTDRSLNGTSSVKNGEEETVPEAFGNFDRIVGPLKLDYANVKLAKWQSRETGLTVVWVDMEGPLVNGYFTVATEIFDDSGCPHTLEHLIFLGSEKYPYKGILDSLANRAFARGTNAWTDTGHTAYTITTAGEDGFLRLLPVYVDHVLYPTITSAGYVTEVHHVNGKGEDAGVVYSEMQGRENGGGDLMALRAQRSLYPEGSGYRSETGGLMEALRVLNVEKIRQYHSTYYAPHNLALLITGKVSPTKLLQVLQDTVEPSIIAHQQAHGPKGPSGWKRPFLETGSKGGGRVEKGQKEEVVEFPEKDESSGEVQISWVGPKTTDLMGDAALDLLTTYLSDSAVSPLSKEFIEIDDPFCTDITFYSTDGEVTVMSAYLSSVPTEHLKTISTQFRSAIARAADEGIDMNRMGMLIERGRLRVLNQMETDATDSFATGVISDFLYGDRTGKNLVEGMTEEMKRWETLGSWSSEQWAKELKRWLVDNPSLVVIGKPSAALADKLDADTKARIEATKAKYGEKGLEKLQRDLDAAQKENDVEVPKEILESFPVPSVDTIRWIEVETGRAQPGATSGPSNDLQQLLDSDKADVPVFVQYDHVESNFLTLTAHLSPANLPSELHALLPVYLGAFFSLPVRRADGSELSFEEVVQELDRETIEYDIRIGSVLSQTIELSLKVEKTRYESTVRWLRDLLWGLVFDVDRLRVTAAKILQSLPSMKREGNYVADALYSEQLYDRKLAPSLGMNLLRQDEEIPDILARLKQEPKGVVAELEQLRKHLTDPSTMRISVGGNVKSLSRPKSDFVHNFQKLEPASLKPPLFGSEVLGAQGKQPSGKVVICSMSTIESSFATHVAAGPKGWLHPDLPALSVANSVLNAMESYLWRYIRGAGLAYGASIRMSPETGHVSLRIYRSPDSAKAFAEAGRVIKELVSGKIKLDELTVETAKSSMAYTTAQLESTVGEAAYLSFSNTALKGVPRHFQRELLAKAQQVSLDDCVGAIKKYLLPIFETSSFAVVAASVTKADAIAEALAGQGFDVERRELSASKDSDDESEEGSEEDESMSEAETDGR